MPSEQKLVSDWLCLFIHDLIHNFAATLLLDLSNTLPPTISQFLLCDSWMALVLTHLPRQMGALVILPKATYV